MLRNQAGYDMALVYVSDHGESLGENRPYLHGVPRAIAPSQQTRVPMVVSIPPGFARQQRVELDCVRLAADAQARPDNIFPTILGLVQDSTGNHSPKLDLNSEKQRVGNKAMIN